MEWPNCCEWGHGKDEPCVTAFDEAELLKLARVARESNLPVSAHAFRRALVTMLSLKRMVDMRANTRRWQAVLAVLQSPALPMLPKTSPDDRASLYNALARGAIEFADAVCDAEAKRETHVNETLLVEACRRFFDAPHQEHFAVRMNDEELEALKLIAQLCGR